MKYFCNECGKRIFKNKKEVYKCICGRTLCGKHSFLKGIDENNIAITRNAKIVCNKCK